MNPLLLYGLVSGASSLITGAVNHFSSKSLSNNAFRQNVDMWNRQNLYNSPSFQVGRLRQAGLNPALAYGGSGQVVGNSETPPQLDYQGVYQNPLINGDAIMMANQAMSMASQRKLQESQSNLFDMQAIESANRGVLSGAEANYAEQFALEKLDSMRLSNDKLYADCQNTIEATENLIVSRQVSQENLDALKYANEFARRTMEYRIDATQLANVETRKRMREIDSKVDLNNANVQHVFKLIETATINNSMLPGLLKNDFRKGLQEIQNLRDTDKQINETTKKIASEYHLNEKELSYWLWKNSPGVVKIPGAFSGVYNTGFGDSQYEFK